MNMERDGEDNSVLGAEVTSGSPIWFTKWQFIFHI